jgi:hypothetical protein
MEWMDMFQNHLKLNNFIEKFQSFSNHLEKGIYKAVLNQTMEGSAPSLGRRCEYIGSEISSVHSKFNSTVMKNAYCIYNIVLVFIYIVKNYIKKIIGL